MNVLLYPKIYYANTIQPMLTYTNDANRIQSRLRNGKTTTLCMCHGPGVYHAAVDVTWVPCPYLKSKVARGLSITRILSKLPPIGVMQQTHAMI